MFTNTLVSSNFSVLIEFHSTCSKVQKIPSHAVRRCRGAVVSPREQQIDTLILWIKRAGGAISTRGRNRDPEVIKKEIKEHEVCY